MAASTHAHPWRLPPWGKGELAKVLVEGLPEESTMITATPEKSRKPADQSCELTPPPVDAGPTHNQESKQGLEGLVSSRAFLALSVPNCPQCKELETMLVDRGVDASRIFVKWSKEDPQYPALKAELSKYAGAVFSFPQVFVGGKYEGGFKDTALKLVAGAYDHILESSYEAKLVTVKRCVDEQPMVVFSLTVCPQCDVLRELLEERGLPVNELFVKWDKAAPQYQSLKAQLIKLTGVTQFSFPQTFVRGQFRGSFQEIKQQLQDGELDNFFQEAYGVVPRSSPAAEPVQEGFCVDDDF